MSIKTNVHLISSQIIEEIQYSQRAMELEQRRTELRVTNLEERVTGNIINKVRYLQP